MPPKSRLATSITLEENLPDNKTIAACCNVGAVLRIMNHPHQLISHLGRKYLRNVIVKLSPIRHVAQKRSAEVATVPPVQELFPKYSEIIANFSFKYVVILYTLTYCMHQRNYVRRLFGVLDRFQNTVFKLEKESVGGKQPSIELQQLGHLVHIRKSIEDTVLDDELILGDLVEAVVIINIDEVYILTVLHVHHTLTNY